MNVHRFKLMLTAAIFVGNVAPLWLSGGAALANHDAKDRSDPAEFGEIGPLIMTHKDAISSVLVWTGDGIAEPKTPKVCLWMRNSQYPGSALVDPLLVSPDLGMTGGYRHDFGVLVRAGDPFSPSDPEDPEDGGVADNFSDRLDRATQTPALLDIALDNGLCWDLTDSDAFLNNGKHDIAHYNPGDDGIPGTEDTNEGWEANLDDNDWYQNIAAFSPAGHSAGLNYDVFCSGNVQLADGRILFVGGHDIDGTNGLRQLNIFDPETESWVANAAPPVKTAYLAHPTSTVNAPEPALTIPPPAGMFDPHADHATEIHAPPTSMPALI